MRGKLLEALLVLFIWVLLIVFIIYDTPKYTRISVSPSYWHWLDEHYPREDTAHYQTPPASTGDFYYGGK